MSSREAMLARIRAAVAADHDAVQVPRDYQRTGELPPGSDRAVELLIERLADYQAEVQRAGAQEVHAQVLASLGTASSVVLPLGLPDDLGESLTAAGLTVVIDGDPHSLTAAELDRIDAVVTTATVAIAVNGTIVLDAGPGQGRRIISLVPDLHVVILRRSQVVETVPEAIAQLTPERPVTLIAGPSATSDIELSRVEGVHGPRTLRVVIVDDAPPGSAEVR